MSAFVSLRALLYTTSGSRLGPFGSLRIALRSLSFPQSTMPNSSLSFAFPLLSWFTLEVSSDEQAILIYKEAEMIMSSGVRYASLS